MERRTNPEAVYLEQFAWRLRRDCAGDEACQRIAADKEFARDCAIWLRRYIDPAFREWADGPRLSRVEKLWRTLPTIITGLELGADWFRQMEPETSTFFQLKAAQVQEQLQKLPRLENTDRYGRFRDEGLLLSAKIELQKRLGSPPSGATLANLINSAQLAFGTFTEQDNVEPKQIDDNLRNYLKRNKS
jgi:hypothetical protein